MVNKVACIVVEVDILVLKMIEGMENRLTLEEMTVRVFVL